MCRILLMKGIVIKIKKGKEVVWREWCNKIKNEYSEEAIKTLSEEKCLQELFAIFQIGDSWYTIGMGEGECLPSNKITELNRIHEEKKFECLDSNNKSPIETLYHLKSI